jgi:hypothetical protein
VRVAGDVQNAQDGGRNWIEPAHDFLQASAAFVASVSAETVDTKLRTQKLGAVREVIEAWPKLSPELRAAVLVVTRTVTK